MIYILLAIIISAAIAYLGDVIGSVIGKKRLTVFGLRPRKTAMVVAIVTGILITLLTLGVSALLSEEVRTALFYMDDLKKGMVTLKTEIDTLQAQVKGLSSTKTSLENEKAVLTEHIESLRSAVKIKETENIAFRKDEPLAMIVIEAGQEFNDVMKNLTNFIISLSDKATTRGVQVKTPIEFFKDNKNQLDLMAQHISSSSENIVVSAIAVENIASGEELGNVRFVVFPNRLVYTKNAEIAEAVIDGTQDRVTIARDLQEFMEAIDSESVSRGMLANPLTGAFGNMTYESLISFYDMVNSIKEKKSDVTVAAYALTDTYTAGPLNVALREKN
ncbi:MAG: DUF3084 domain-containing protein [Candidatus Riflebacteria bacterium]|nr:DUF3084 domain-containing protein [Candidatus Riflebacteria bacterium]